MKNFLFIINPSENVKRLKDIDQLIELHFCEPLDVIKTDQAFSGYAMPCKNQIVERKDPIVQLKSSKLSIKNLVSDLLNETKSFKYQITVKALLKNTSLMEKLNLDRFILIP